MENKVVEMMFFFFRVLSSQTFQTTSFHDPSLPVLRTFPYYNLSTTLSRLAAETFQIRRNQLRKAHGFMQQ